MIDPDTGLLRLEIGRADVYTCGYDPRLPIGYLVLNTSGRLVNGHMVQRLHSATVEGAIRTTAGTCDFSVFTSAESPMSVLNWTCAGDEADVATFVLKAEPAVARTNGPTKAYIHPHPTCTVSSQHRNGRSSRSNVSGTVGGVDGDVNKETLQTCTQYLSCDPVPMRTSFSTAVLTVSTPSSAGSSSGALFVSVGNHQPTANQLPRPLEHNLSSIDEAVGNVRAASALGMAALRAMHESWWSRYFESQSCGSFLSLPNDRRSEALYHIQQAKIGS
jgi:hypothetical protein